MPTAVKEETYEITRAETGMIEDNVEPGPGREEWDEIFRVQVPIGISYVFTPENVFSLYMIDLVQDVEGCISDDGGVQTDETADARNATVNDVVLLPAVMTVNDALYVGLRHPFTQVRIKYSTRGDGVGTVTWEYWTGAAWVALTGVVDGTSNFSAAAGTYLVTFTLPKNWAKTAVKGFSMFWVRGRVSAVTTAGTAATTGDQAWMHYALEHRATDLIKVERRDSSENVRVPLIGPTQYALVKEFADVDKKAHLDIAGVEIAREGEWLAALIQSTAGVIDASESYLSLTCKRIRHTLFE